MQTIKLLKKHEDAKMPVRAHERDAGFDVFAVEAFTVKAGEDILIPTGWAMRPPEGHYFQVATKSGLGTKRKICTDIAGVIDEDYRGVTHVQMWNFGKEDQTFEKGDKIAQFLCLPVSYAALEEVVELNDTDRGAGGFGSTGQQ
jgi:dUTP pyrophosphatase